jgi:N-acetylmuramoyl-L-alanine amidase
MYLCIYFFILINILKTLKMRPLYVVIAVICLFLTANCLQIYAGNPVKVVVIDAGHGGNDPGAIGISGVNEKAITLALALKLGALIEKNTNVKVVYTRKTDVAVELYKRSQIANDNHADYFISIHCNSVEKNASVSGAETFVMGLSKTESNLAIAQKENAAILNEQDHENNYDGFDPTSPESYILFTIHQNAYRNQSINLAATVQSELKTFCKRQDRGVKEAGFLVLWRSAMPSILVEAGFLSNKEEEAYLASEKGQAELALALYNGFAKTAHLSPLQKPDFSNLADTIPSNVKSSYTTVYRVQFLTN